MRLLNLLLSLTVTLVLSSNVGLAVQETEENAAEKKQDKQDTKAEEEQDDLIDVLVNDDTMTFKAPKAWESVEPKFSMIEAEFSIKADDDGEGDEKEAPGRLTIMSSGGGVDGNIQRWYGQFTQPDGGSTEDASKVEEIELEGLAVHMVDISGDYLGGPGSSGEKLEGYRMLAAILETGGDSAYFIKFYGPAKIIDANAERFEKFVKSLKVEQ